MIVILLESLIAFAIMAIIVSQYSYFKMIGGGIIVSWGCAGAIHSLNFVALNLVSYGVVTFCWARVCKKWCEFLLD